MSSSNEDILCTQSCRVFEVTTTTLRVLVSKIKQIWQILYCLWLFIIRLRIKDFSSTWWKSVRTRQSCTLMGTFSHFLNELFEPSCRISLLRLSISHSLCVTCVLLTCFFCILLFFCWFVLNRAHWTNNSLTYKPSDYEHIQQTLGNIRVLCYMKP